MMKRQLIEIGLLTATLSSLTGTLPAIAQSARRDITVPEREGSTKHIGQLENNANYLIEGNLGGSSDREDELSFDISREGFYRFSFDSIRGSFLRQKITIIGNNGFRVSGSNGTSSVLKPGAYVLQLEGETRGGEFISYRTKIATPVPTKRTIILEVKSATALDTFDSGSSTQRKADFYVQANINNVKQSTSSVKGNSNNPTFNYKTTQSVSGNLEFIPITVVLRDEDRLSKDDLADVNPSSRNRGLPLKYFPETGEIVNTSDNKILERNGFNPAFFNVRGNNGPKAELTLRISHTNQ